MAELKNGKVTSFEVSPEDAGLPVAKAEDLKGGDATTNAQAIFDMLDGKQGAYRDIVLYNTAAALIVADKASNLKEGVDKAAEAIDSGKARATLDALCRITEPMEEVKT